jgi:hypothetical protein
MDKDKPHRSFGVFKPVGHVMISFPDGEQQGEAARALVDAGIAERDITRYTPEQMLGLIDEDLARASPLAAVGQELNLAKAHRVLAEHGYHWLIVHAPDDDVARRVADTVAPFGAERAQHYGHFVIEELIEHPSGGKPQVHESPDTGLDAETPSGLEVERVRRGRST